jgi:hypothetical protein
MKELTQKEIEDIIFSHYPIAELIKRTIFQTIETLIVNKNSCEILKKEKFVKSKIYVDHGFLNKEYADLVRLVVKKTFEESLQ